ncbi:CatB-related O-acetyltransferase [Phaeovulum vinaykumarii]|uniref:Transferase hexapeptide (Six repeat-containing protein) n=1 Tax=Phaeovulum vinaykumarii TaxID=407234 RepID=A0A1N7KD65_9RHOB|nr:CatB-related O-acetyltransferase [Phaeovulum vinaykumarii]SIS59556.1 transferase hexapeptide (six repeat-containing protein) [Phaeovulum vinaykumarii]SOB94149.1 transferase family hexapeptide repeat protein [Phaeovulum vinaykumarii]
MTQASTHVSLSPRRLRAAGIEIRARLPLIGKVRLPRASVIEAPAGLKATRYDHSLEMGAFSYQASGYCFAARIGRYCSFGEDVQIGRHNHPMHWISTSPAFFDAGMLAVGQDFPGGPELAAWAPVPPSAPETLRPTHIGHDVWIGHGAFVRAGVSIGNGAVVAAGSVVVHDVPAYGIVAGNPARLKRHRFAPELIARFQAARWWRFAPWQMAHLDPTRPDAFLDGIEAMQGTPEFAPRVIDLRHGHP